MTRRLSPDEARMLHLIAKAGGSWCPDDEAWARHEVRDTLRSLERKKRVTAEANEGVAPLFLLTGFGWEDAAHG